MVFRLVDQKQIKLSDVREEPIPTEKEVEEKLPILPIVGMLGGLVILSKLKNKKKRRKG